MKINYERLIVLASIIATNPGIKFTELQQLAKQKMPSAPATLLRDIAALKGFNLLGNRRHKSGYFLKGGQFTDDELRIVLNGLRTQANDLESPQARDLYMKLQKRLKTGRSTQRTDHYPIEAVKNRPTMTLSRDRHSYLIEELKGPIVEGLVVELNILRDPWKQMETGKKGEATLVVYPLQLIFHDIGWYLLAEKIDTKKDCFEVIRIDRIDHRLTIRSGSGRGERSQLDRLTIARNLLDQSWGMAMPSHTLDGRLSCVEIEYRLQFEPRVATFVLEANLLHINQEIVQLEDGSVSFSIILPECQTTLSQFKRWVLNWGASVTVLSPLNFREEVWTEFDNAVQNYEIVT